MTAEIAIMNRTALALAADSAVTVATPRGDKIYADRKLFALSKHHPVAVMVYGNARFLDVPWETTIAVFKSNLGTSSCPTIDEYVHRFVRFLETNYSLFPQRERDEHIRAAFHSWFRTIRKEIDSANKKLLSCKTGLTLDQVKTVVNEKIDQSYAVFRQAKLLPTFSAAYVSRTFRRYQKAIRNASRDVFDKLPISPAASRKLSAGCKAILFTNAFPQHTSNLVIAGYGDEQMFPALKALQIHGVLHKKLKYRLTHEVAVGPLTSAAIVPFAQADMVNRFMEGVDPFYQEAIEAALTELFKGFPGETLKNLRGPSKNLKHKLQEQLTAHAAKLLADLQTRLKDLRQAKFVQPVINAVAILPKHELAAMAEALVSLTAFKRRVSIDTETVGAPIDVAILSPGHGLVWIKRQEYFAHQLNPHFITRYYSETSGRNRRS